MFSHDTPKTLIFDALIRGKACFLMMRPKTKCTFDALIRGKACFLMMRQNLYICCIITWKSRFSHYAPKRCKFVALLRVKAGFLMTQPRTKCIFDALLCFKQVFS